MIMQFSASVYDLAVTSYTPDRIRNALTIVPFTFHNQRV
jgi:hypothetical protein